MQTFLGVFRLCVCLYYVCYGVFVLSGAFVQSHCIQWTNTAQPHSTCEIWCPVWGSAAAPVVTQTHRLSPTPGHIQVFVSAPVFTAHMTQHAGCIGLV